MLSALKTSMQHLLLGQDVDVVEHRQVVSSMVRVASRLGLRRLARDVTAPSLAVYLAQRHTDEDEERGDDGI